MQTSSQRLNFPIQAALDAIIYCKLLDQTNQVDADKETNLIQLCACLYLAAKVNEFELVKIRDIINVVQFTTMKTIEAEIPEVQGDEEMLDE